MNKELRDLSRIIDECLSGHEERINQLIYCMLNNMSQGFDLSPLAPLIIKLLVLPQLPLKKVLSTYLIRYGDEISNLNILAVNSLLKDFKDPNPQVRRLVLKIVCSVSSLKELSHELLLKALVDSNASVRRTAVCYCPKVIDSGHPIVEQLYAMIRDQDPLVVTSCISALEDILKEEGGMVINSKLARYLIARMTEFPEWGFTISCEVLKKYKPKSEEEVIEYLNILDDKLESRNPVIFISALQLVFRLIRSKCENLEIDLIERVSDQLIFLLGNSSPENLLVILDLVKELIPKHNVFSRHYKHFLCRFSDVVYIKVKKLGILPLLINNTNYSIIVDELLSHCTNACHVVSAEAVNSLMSVLSTSTVVCEKTIENLSKIMYLNKGNLNEKIIKCFNSSDIVLNEELKQLFFAAFSEQCLGVSTIKGKEAVLSLISKYGENICNAPYILEHMLNEEANTSDERVYATLLTTAVKLFLSRPVEMQLLLGNTLQQASESSSPLVKKQALFYYNLLKADSQLAIKVLLTV